MFIEDTNEDFYKILRGKQVLLFVNNDVDALCASKIFQNLLVCQSVQYTLVTVEGLEELSEAYQNYSEQFKCIILINCGGSIDVVESLQPEEDVIIFVVDSHKPTDVCNVYSRSQIRLLGKPDPSEKIPEFEEIFQDSDDEAEEDELTATEEELLRRREKKKWMEKRDLLMHEYTQFSFYGRASSLVVYELICRRGMENIDCLWWAIVGLTYQTLYGLVDESKYNAELPFLQLQLSRLSPMMTELNKSDTLKITTQKDLKLMLYRHWTVQNSLRYSMLTALKLKSWNIQGEKRLHQLLAEMGLPLSESVQNFTSMDISLRNEFYTMVKGISEKYKLEQLIYPCFVLSHGYRHSYQAGDYVHALFGLLATSDDKPCKDRFNEALDCLSRNKFPLLNTGIEKAKRLIQTIYNEAQTIIDVNSVINAGPFLYFVSSEGSTVENKTYSSPLALFVLARYVLQFYAVSSKVRRAGLLPLIASASCPGEDCLVLGIPPAAEIFPRNFFGKAFERALDQISVTPVLSYFDTSVIKIKKSDRPKFFDALVTIFG